MPLATPRSYIDEELAYQLWLQFPLRIAVPKYCELTMTKRKPTFQGLRVAALRFALQPEREAETKKMIEQRFIEARQPHSEEDIMAQMDKYAKAAYSAKDYAHWRQKHFGAAE